VRIRGRACRIASQTAIVRNSIRRRRGRSLRQRSYSTRHEQTNAEPNLAG
jgi:hypothetical protein